MSLKDKFLNLRFFVESGASAFTLAGIYIGSTTALGAMFYLISLIFWFWLMIRWKMWGLVPLNVATLGIVIYNLMAAL
jgi:hypothetical protein